MNRWIIEGTLKLISPLHIGAGDPVPQAQRSALPGDVAACATDARGLPYLPASSLRGALRQSFAQHFPDALESLFGSLPESGGAVAGRLRIFDAFLHQEPDATAQARYAKNYLYDRKRCTLIEPLVAIDRVTGAANADEHKLAHVEVVVPGTLFEFQAVVEQSKSSQPAEIVQLLQALASLREQGLGAAATGGAGRMELATYKVKRFGNQQLAKWVEKPADDWRLFACVEKHLPQWDPLASTAQAVLGIKLDFESDFAVADIWRVKYDANGKKVKGEPDFRPRINADGKPLLPARSFTGALRSQTERILRTMGALSVAGEGLASAPELRPDATEPQEVADQLQHDLASLLFGCAAWRGLLQASDFVFVATGATVEVTRDFVAIDRFQGGAADGAKFQAEAFYQPKLTGTLHLDEFRFAKLRQESQSALLGLLALVLRDLQEGDISFGHGSSKGFGACKGSASVVAADVGNPLAPLVDRGQKVRNAVAAQSDNSHWHAALLAHLGLTPGDSTAVPPITVPTQATPGAATAMPVTHPNNSFFNPYHFLPVSAPETSQWLPVPVGPFTADGLGAAAHHRYLNSSADGEAVYSGEIECRLTAITPFFVGGGRNEHVSLTTVECFSRNGQLAVPASSLRGLISNLIEAATHSTLRVLRDSILSYRKPAAQALASLGRIVPLPTPTPFDGLALLPLEYDAVELADIAVIRQELKAGEVLRQMDHRARKLIDTRRHEVIALPPALGAQALPLSQTVVDRFHALADERTADCTSGKKRPSEEALLPYHPLGTQRNLNEAEYGKKLRLKPGDLVYYALTANAQEVAEVAFSAIWRGQVQDKAGHGAGVHRFFAKISPELLPFSSKRQFVSPAELMLGFTSGDKKIDGKDAAPWRALKSRVLFSDALPVNPIKTVKRARSVTLKILATPKPPSPNLYFKPANDVVNTRGIPKPTLNPDRHLPQGRKAYLHAQKGTVKVSDPPNPPWETQYSENHKEQKVKISPVAGDEVFKFTVRFGNLTRSELQALCFALQPGHTYCHKLGMGKPLGLGSVRIDPIAVRLIDRVERYLHGGPRFHWQWETGTPAVIGQTCIAADFFALRDAYRSNLTSRDPDLLQAIDLLGDPAQVTVPVHYPLTNAQLWTPDRESKHFIWFGINESADPAQRLQPLDKASPGLPPLQAN